VRGSDARLRRLLEGPKSVSLLWAFGDRIPAGGRTLDQLVEQAHDEAVGAAMGYLEASAARGRRGRNGVVQRAAASLRPSSASARRAPTTRICTATC